MKAAILAIGSELLGTERLDTNSLRLTKVLERYGVELVGKSVRPDDETAIADELRRFAQEADLVLITGGLGPTADDITRQSLARAFSLGLERNDDLVEALRERFRRFGREMAEVNLQQADVIEGATILANPLGSAVGQRVPVQGDSVRSDSGDATFFLFPGVPRELEGMISDHLEPWLAERSDGSGSETIVFKIAGYGESEIEQQLQPLYDEHGRDGITILASPGEIRLMITARGTADERRRFLEIREASVREAVGHFVFTENADDTLETVVLRELKRRGEMVATAESCTGGLVAERLTRVAGSSSGFAGGVVTYSNELKTQLLGVPAEAIVENGAVSEIVARAMAVGARERLGTDYAISITGIAGPGGGSEEKPVGTVYMALSGPDGTEVFHKVFHGDRHGIRWRTSQHVLEELRRRLVTKPDSGA